MPRPHLSGKEEPRGLVPSEVVTEDPKGPWGVSEVLGHILGAPTFDEDCPQSLILTMFGILRLQKEPLKLCYALWYSCRHA